MWALAGRTLAPWAAGAARLLPLCPRHAAASDPRAACRLFSAAELKVTGSPQDGAGLPHVHGGRAPGLLAGAGWAVLHLDLLQAG